MTARQFWMGVAITLALGCIAVGILLMSGCTHTGINHRLTRADLTPAELAQPIVAKTMDDAEEYDRTHIKRMWGCTAFDAGTTILGLAIGFSEASPLGLFVLPYSIWANLVAHSELRSHGDPTVANTLAVMHCGAGGLNILTIAGAL